MAVSMMNVQQRLKTSMATVALLGLAACAQLQPQQPAQWQPQRALGDFQAEGRLAVQMDGKGSYANFDWMQQRAVRTININTPLGNTLGQLCQDRHGVLAMDSKGQVYEAADAAELSERLLGFGLPVQYLDVWAAGQWVAGAPHQILPDGRLQQFEWTVSRSLNAEGRVRVLQLSSPKLSLRLVFDAFEPVASESGAGVCSAREGV